MQIKQILTAVLFVALLTGCHASRNVLHPDFAPSEGAITGQLINSDKDPFDLALAGDEGAKAIKIELHGSSGVIAVTYPQKEKSRFSFSHVAPGQYEISVYLTVPGKRSIAGSTPVTIDPGKITPVVITLTVTPAKN